MVLSKADARVRIAVDRWEVAAVTGGARDPRPWPAPAKLNLFLHIVGRRPDGYHELQTCFQFVDLCDEVTIAPRDDGAIRLSAGAPGVDPEQDLCVRAALALKAATGTRRGADISVLKRIPMGAGLGGGSSDAATCLVALNQLWALDLSVDELAALGLKLGADVPVFVRGRAAWAEGVGERLIPLDPPLAPTECNYLIIKPNVFVSTRDVFQDPELTRNSPPITIHGFLAAGGRNDCLRGGAAPISRGRARHRLAFDLWGGAPDWDGGVCFHGLRAGACPGDRRQLAGGIRGIRGSWTERLALAREVSGLKRRRGSCAHSSSFGVSPSGKAAGFDPAIRRFESFHPSHFTSTGSVCRPR